MGQGLVQKWLAAWLFELCGQSFCANATVLRFRLHEIVITGFQNDAKLIAKQKISSQFELQKCIRASRALSTRSGRESAFLVPLDGARVLDMSQKI